MSVKALQLVGFLAGGIFLGAVSASAQDKATLDLLVRKGLITQADADAVGKSTAPVSVTPNNALVKGLKLQGMIQTQYDWITTDDHAAGSSNPPSTNQFFIRRAYFGALANLGNGWGGEIMIDFAAGAQVPGGSQAGGGNAAQNLFEKIVITKDVDNFGRFTAGYQKVNFVLEEYTSTSVLKVIERSIATRYFDETYTALTNGRLGFADRHNGLYWDGKIADLPGFMYGAAITTGIQSSSGYGPVGGFNKFAGWAYVGYAGNLTDLDYVVGVNFGYTPEGNSNTGPGATPVTASSSNAVWGYNPYIKFNYLKKAELTAEFIQTQVANGRFNSVTGLSDASPYGFNITPSYRINDEWEVVARYSYLNTNGRGVQISQVTRNGANVLPAVAGTTPQFDSAQGLYVGVNWYLIGNSVKLSAGYEWNEFSGRGTTATAGPTAGNNNFTGAKAYVNGFRTRLQLLF